MPTNIRIPRLYYGWWVVIATFFISLLVGGVVIYGFTTIFEPIAEEFSWSYAQISFAASLRGVEVGLLAPLMGILVDQWGPRRLLFMGAITVAAGLILLSRVNSLVTFYGAFILVATGMSACVSTVLMTAVANWFHRRVGLAIGIAVSGMGAGGLMVPIMIALIDEFEWRTTLVILAICIMVIVLPLSMLLRHKPEQYGYLPDGDVAPVNASNEENTDAQTAEVNVTSKQAFRSSTFWRMALAFTIQFTGISAIVTHVMPYLSSVGIARANSGIVGTALPLLSITGRLGFGWLSDKLNRRWVAVGSFMATGIGLIFFAYVTDAAKWMILPFLILFGMGYGGHAVMKASLCRGLFGRVNFGTILGLIMGIGMIGEIGGTPLAGWVFDTWGSYRGIWLIFGGLSIAAIALLLTLFPVKTKDQP